MTEEEKQVLMAIMLREQQSPELGGEMIPLQDEGTPQDQYSSYQGQPMQSQGGMSPMQMAKYADAAPAVSGNASGAAMSNSYMPAATAYPTGAGSMAGSSAAAEMAAGTGAGAPVSMPAGVGGGSGGGGMMAAAGPWAALAAAIVGNESQAKGTDRRADSDGEYIGDLLTGTVGAQDGKYMGEKVGGPIGSSMTEASRFSEKMMKGLKPWEWF